MDTYNKDYLDYAHKRSTYHKNELFESHLCGCFYCEQTYKSTEIIEWIDENQTALCPKCGVDSVLSSKFPISDPTFLHQMHIYWFS